MKHRDREHSEDPRKVEVEAEERVELTEETEQDILDADLAALQDEIEKLRQDAEESRNSYLRTLADFDNFRKRQREEIARQVGCAREDLILKLLPILDNSQRAIDAAEAQHSYDSLVEGVTLTMRQISDLLTKEGLEPIDAVGQEFNPELHEAMMLTETDEYPENTIIEEFEKGYTLGGRVLRPARVRVAAKG